MEVVALLCFPGYFFPSVSLVIMASVFVVSSPASRPFAVSRFRTDPVSQISRPSSLSDVYTSGSSVCNICQDPHRVVSRSQVIGYLCAKISESQAKRDYIRLISALRSVHASVQVCTLRAEVCKMICFSCCLFLCKRVWGMRAVTAHWLYNRPRSSGGNYSIYCMSPFFSVSHPKPSLSPTLKSAVTHINRKHTVQAHTHMHRHT